ncbi:MAG: ATP-binding protein [Deltaproteobacteria bacterium]|nr:ATP-binding protein [Deltaproteobacteria bacterium]MBI3295388.1 ATP-binding protein [Deltaproteobacteria bacterium]
MKRPYFLEKIQAALSQFPVTGLLGPRQCGKTTLAREHCRSLGSSFQEKLNYFDLEDPEHLARLANPLLALEPLQGVVVIDEIQRRPELFPVLRVLADRKKHRSRFLILGSASRELIHQASETLAGRIEYIEVTPFSAHELKSSELQKLWIRGGFPRAFLATANSDSIKWRNAFIRTYLEQDLPNLGIRIPAETLRRFWLMLAHYHGQIFNASEIGRSMGIADTTVHRYLDILVGTFMVRRLSPWIENLKKRQVKSPKVYFRDSGVLHSLLGLRDREDLLTYPGLGRLWEGFAIEELLRKLGVDQEEAFFWGVHEQAELDLFILKNGKRLGFEIKYTDHPSLTASMKNAVETLKLHELTIVYPGSNEFRIDKKVRAIGLSQIILARSANPQTLP